MLFGTTTYRPAEKVSPSSTPIFPDVDDVSKVFQKPSWGFLPVPGGPDILRSGPATAASDRALEILDYAGGSCDWALEQQSRLFTSLAARDLSKTLDYIREKGLRGVSIASEDSRFYILDEDTWDELLGVPDACLRIITQQPLGWTESGVREVVEAWDRYADPSAVAAEHREDAGDDSDESELYEDAKETLDHPWDGR